jgi:hypothetical protein
MPSVDRPDLTDPEGARREPFLTWVYSVPRSWPGRRRPLRGAFPPKWLNKSVHKGPDRNHLGGKAPLTRWHLGAEPRNERGNPVRARCGRPANAASACGRNASRSRSVRSQGYRGCPCPRPPDTPQASQLSTIPPTHLPLSEPRTEFTNGL